MSSLIVLLDSGPLGLITHPKANAENLACRTWLDQVTDAGNLALLPEIIDYEHRRELIRISSLGIERLDRIKQAGFYLPLTTEAMLLAAQYWAEIRQLNLAGTDNLSLDADMILCAQAATLDPNTWDMPEARVVIATTNVKHLSHFAEAHLWRDIVAG